MGEARAFYRDRFTDSQRRRVEALLVVATLWPHVDPERCQLVAQWLVRGEARIKVK